jgi:hypothetical protein
MHSKRWRALLVWCLDMLVLTGTNTVSNRGKKYVRTQDTTCTTYIIISLQISTTSQKEIRENIELTASVARE